MMCVDIVLHCRILYCLIVQLTVCNHRARHHHQQRDKEHSPCRRKEIEGVDNFRMFVALHACFLT